MTDRRWGSGSVTQWRGRWRARLPLALGRNSLGVYDTREEAEAVLTAAMERLASAPVQGETLAAYGARWMRGREVRESTLSRDVARWRCYVEQRPIGALALPDVTAGAVERWLRDLDTLAPQTRQNALTLLRGALAAACRHDGPLAGRANPAAGLTVGRKGRARTSDSWTWLRQHEIDAVAQCDAIPLRSRLIFTVAIHTGLRAGELWGLRWIDVDRDRRVLTVAHNRLGPTKSGRPREVPLLEPALVALERWRALYRAQRLESRHGLVWPARDGGPHADGYDAGWSSHRVAAGIDRRVVFHDLRHTCASHLVQGSWSPTLIARPLRIEEVRDWLGHADITTTQRYAHLCSDAIAGLVQRAELVTNWSPAPSHLRDLNSGPTVYETGGGDAAAAAIDASAPWVTRVVTSLRALSTRAAESISRGDVWRDHRALDLVEAVETACDALESARGDAHAETA